MKTKTILALPKIHALMLGLYRVELNHPTYTLTYTDGTKESAEVPDMTQEDVETVFPLVRKVQEVARKA